AEFLQIAQREDLRGTRRQLTQGRTQPSSQFTRGCICLRRSTLSRAGDAVGCVERLKRRPVAAAQEVECTIDCSAIEIAARVGNDRHLSLAQSQKDSLRDILRIRHVAQDAVGSQQYAPVVLSEETGQTIWLNNRYVG